MWFQPLITTGGRWWTQCSTLSTCHSTNCIYRYLVNQNGMWNQSLILWQRTPNQNTHYYYCSYNMPLRCLVCA